MCLFAKFEENQSNIPTAIETLSSGLASASSDRRLRHQLGLMLLKYEPSQAKDIEANLKAAVIIPGNDYMPRFHLACFLFQIGNYAESYQNFEELNNIDIPRAESLQVRWTIRDESGNHKYFTGQVVNVGYDYGFIRCEFLRNVYFNRWALTTEERERITINSSVSFYVGFNTRGPLALDVQSVST